MLRRGSSTLPIVGIWKGGASLKKAVSGHHISITYKSVSPRFIPIGTRGFASRFAAAIGSEVNRYSKDSAGLLG